MQYTKHPAESGHLSSIDVIKSLLCSSEAMSSPYFHLVVFQIIIFHLMLNIPTQILARLTPEAVYKRTIACSR